MKIVTIVGARPQFIKAAAVTRAIGRWNAENPEPPVDEVLVHTGQHFDEAMSSVFFEELELRQPDHNLHIAGGSHGQMTGRMLAAVEEVLLDERPDWVVTYGDTNSTLAGALAAVKLHIPTAHVEAGLRSWNRAMPEEINRLVADGVSDVLFTPTDSATRNLLGEGVPQHCIHQVGDVMFDAVVHYRQRALVGKSVLAELGLEPDKYILATIHRAENTDDPVRLKGIMDGLAMLTDGARVVLPLHPRTRKALEATGLMSAVDERVALIEPVGYLEMLQLETAALLVATDSGGVQKEAYFVGTPCLTLRDETEWVELVDLGVNRLVGAEPERIAAGATEVLKESPTAAPVYGAGDAADQLVAVLATSTRRRRVDLPPARRGDRSADELKALLVKKNEQAAELRSKLLDTRRALNEKLEAARKDVRALKRQLALYERRHRMKGVDAIAHNQEASMDDFFTEEPDPEPYVRFGASLRQELRRYGIALDGRTVADAGVGLGIALKELLRGSEPKEVIGFDFSSKALETASELLPHARFEHRGIYDEPTEQFDVVISTEVLEHLERPDEALRSLARMLRPRGVLVLTVPDGRIDFSEKHVNFWSPESWGLFLRATLPQHDVRTGVFQPYPETGHQTNLGLVTAPSHDE